MNILIEVLCLILFVICVCLFGLHKINVEAIKELKRDYKEICDEQKRTKSKLNSLDISFMNFTNEQSKIEIIHKYDDKDAPDFPHSGGF